MPKLGKENLSAFNCRPKKLLNCDYKTTSKVIDHRFYPLLPKHISKNQNGFIKGRNMGDNKRLIFDVIDNSNCKAILGSML